VTAPTDPASSSERPGYATPAAYYPVRPPRHTSHMRLLVALSITMVVVIAISVLIAWLFTPAPPQVDCKYTSCGQPPIRPPVGTPPGGPVAPITGNGPALFPQSSDAQPQAGPGKPVQTYPRFTAANKSWSVSYPPGVDPPANASHFGWDYTAGPVEGSSIEVFGGKAGARTAQNIVASLIEDRFPGAELSYQIPNATVGYQPGYGEIRDFTPQSGTASYQRGRVVAVVAIKNGVALGLIGVGPFYQFTPGDPTSHPSGANSLIALWSSSWVNSFMWKGDPPR
jgi:hypothetical protein